MTHAAPYSPPRSADTERCVLMHDTRVPATGPGILADEGAPRVTRWTSDTAEVHRRGRREQRGALARMPEDEVADRRRAGARLCGAHRERARRGLRRPLQPLRIEYRAATPRPSQQGAPPHSGHRARAVRGRRAGDGEARPRRHDRALSVRWRRPRQRVCGAVREPGRRRVPWWLPCLARRRSAARRARTRDRARDRPSGESQVRVGTFDSGQRLCRRDARSLDGGRAHRRPLWASCLPRSRRGSPSRAAVLGGPLGAGVGARAANQERSHGSSHPEHSVRAYAAWLFSETDLYRSITGAGPATRTVEEVDGVLASLLAVRSSEARPRPSSLNRVVRRPPAETRPRDALLEGARTGMSKLTQALGEVGEALVPAMKHVAAVGRALSLRRSERSRR